LSPVLVESIFGIIARINAEQGTAMLLVEQNASVALAIADYGYIMEMGKVVIDGSAEKLAGDADVREFYLGMGGAGERRSFRDVKHYKRRKRWLSWGSGHDATLFRTGSPHAAADAARTCRQHAEAGRHPAKGLWHLESLHVGGLLAQSLSCGVGHACHGR